MFHKPTLPAENKREELSAANGKKIKSVFILSSRYPMFHGIALPAENKKESKYSRYKKINYHRPEIRKSHRLPIEKINQLYFVRTSAHIPRAATPSPPKIKKKRICPPPNNKYQSKIKKENLEATLSFPLIDTTQVEHIKNLPSNKGRFFYVAFDDLFFRRFFCARFFQRIS